jgi:hypothetical protein
MSDATDSDRILLGRTTEPFPTPLPAKRLVYKGEELRRKREGTWDAATMVSETSPEGAALRAHRTSLEKVTVAQEIAVERRKNERPPQEPTAPPTPLTSTVQSGTTKGELLPPVQSKSAEREPGRNNYSTIRLTSPRPVARTPAWGTTKAEVLSRAKAAVEDGEDLRISAERLACAQEDFHASLREIGRAIGRSASWISRLLKWRRSGYLQPSPFGPTTRSGRAARRNSNKNDANGCRGGQQQTSGARQSAGSIKFTDPSIPQEPSQAMRPDSDEAAPMGLHGQTSRRDIREDTSDNSNATSVECRSLLRIN